MPVPTPPKKDLFKVDPPKLASKPKLKVPRGPSKATQKMGKDIRDLTKAMADDKNTVLAEIEAKTELKVMVAKTQKKVYPDPRVEHMTQSPFRDNEDLRELQRNLNKSELSKPQKREIKKVTRPLRKTTGEK